MNLKLSVIFKLNAIVLLLVTAVLAVIGIALQWVPADARTEFLTLAGTVLLAAGTGCTLLRLSIRAGILKSVRAASYVIGRAAEGDLTAKVGVRAQGETQKMLDALEVMTRDLGVLVSEVARSARTVATSSGQIAQGHRELSARTEHQASTLEETASSIEELTSTVQHNADNARQASDLARTASEVARRGGRVVADVVATMNDISTSAGRISEISSVIDGIAFQTNLLALNAAVEAARAGEQGRGFAVVAGEVRTLAQRSAAAAREIKQLIGDSVQKVATGSRLVGTAGTTMDEIVGSVQRVSELIAEIAAASNEQSTGIGQVNTAVGELEQGIQQNAAMAEETASSTQALNEQAQLLLQLVSRFRVDQAAAAAQPQAAASAPAWQPRLPLMEDAAPHPSF